MYLELRVSDSVENPNVLLVSLDISYVNEDTSEDFRKYSDDICDEDCMSRILLFSRYIEDFSIIGLVNDSIVSLVNELYVSLIDVDI